MRILVPAALAALIAAVAMSTPAVVPMAGARPSSARATKVTSTQVSSATPAHPSAVSTLMAIPTTTRDASRGGFAWPLSPRPAVIRRFEQPRSQWSHGHRGVDLLTTVGQPVLSAGAGVVAFSGKIAGRGVITVRHPGGLRTTYEPVDDRLASGALIHRGARIGVVSPTPGHCAQLTCLHWGAISGETYQDPLSLLGFGRPILLPLG